MLGIWIVCASAVQCKTFGRVFLFLFSDVFCSKESYNARILVFAKYYVAKTRSRYCGNGDGDLLEDLACVLTASKACASCFRAALSPAPLASCVQHRLCVGVKCAR